MAIRSATLPSAGPAADPGLARGYFGIDVPFMDTIGLEPLDLSEGLCRTRLAPRPGLVNSRGDVHGGSIMSALDFTLCAAARSHDPLAWGTITVDMTTHFYAPARTALIIEGRCAQRGRSMVFCEGEVRDAQGVVVAVARGVFKLVAVQEVAP